MQTFVLVWLLGACTHNEEFDTDSASHHTDTASIHGTDTSAASADEEMAPLYAIMPIHLDPGNPPKDRITGLPNTSRPESHFRHLIDLTKKADEHEFKLTMMFTPQWAHYITTSACSLPPGSPPTELFQYQGETPSSCLDLVEAFAAHGHEIAVHHHPLDAPSGWDGYTDEISWTADRDFDGADETYFADGGGPNGADPLHLGNISDLMVLVAQLHADGESGIRTATTEEFPSTIQYAVAGGPEAYRDLSNAGDLLSQPCATDRDGHAVWELRMRLFTTESVRSTVLSDELADALTDVSTATGTGWVMGFVTHASNVAETSLVQYADLFTTLAAHGVQINTVSHVMQAFDHTENPAGEMLTEHPCPT